MWSGPDIWATIIGGAGLIWGVIAFFIARSAQKNADSANVRSAQALERANELTEQFLTPPPPAWTLTFGAGNMWNLQNDTGHVVSGVYIQSVGGDFHEQGSTWDRIQPKGQIQLQAVASFIDATINVIWTKPEGGGKNTLPVTVRSPHV